MRIKRYVKEPVEARFFDMIINNRLRELIKRSNDEVQLIKTQDVKNINYNDEKGIRIKIIVEILDDLPEYEDLIIEP